MEATQKRDASAARNGARVRLRMEVYDALAAKRDVTTPVDQAELHGISRSQMYRIRSGEWQPSLPLAMRMAGDLGTTVDALFEWVER